MNKTITLLIMTAATTLGGCGGMSLNTMKAHPEAPAATPSPPSESEYIARAARQENQGDSAVETALAWAKKYADAQMRVATLEQENRNLSDRNHTLTTQLDTAKTQLGAAQRELSEANAMMKDLEARLAKWQESVLGYRQEMREAQKAQMDALVKIIRLLGGEAPNAPQPRTAGAQP